MTHDVLLTEGAEHDLEEIHDYIVASDSKASANHVLDRLLAAIETLVQFPDRGAHPKELLTLGIRDYRETHFKPYRLIYRVTGHQVLIHLIVDGRRDIQALLARRLLGG